MKVGDLVRYWKDDEVGIITAVGFCLGYYRVLFPASDIELSYVSRDDLEVLNDRAPDFFRCRVLWNDGDKTWEEPDSILSPEQKEDLEEMNESR